MRGLSVSLSLSSSCALEIEEVVGRWHKRSKHNALATSRRIFEVSARSLKGDELEAGVDPSKRRGGGGLNERSPKSLFKQEVEKKTVEDR